jgi:hypothetical protein
MSKAHYSCRYCGMELERVRIGEYWVYLCPSPECKARRRAEQGVHNVQSPLFVVRTALELLSSRLAGDVETETKKLLAAGVTGVQQLQAAMDKLRASMQGSVQEQPSKLKGRAAGQQSQRRASSSPRARSRAPRSAPAAKRGTSSRGPHRHK